MRRTLSILSTMIAGGKRATGRTLGSHSKYDFGESWLVGRETRGVSRLWVTCHDCTQGFRDLFLQSSCLGLHQDHATLAGRRDWAICDFRAHVAHWPSVEQATHDNPWALLTQRYEKEARRRLSFWPSRTSEWFVAGLRWSACFRCQLFLGHASVPIRGWQPPRPHLLPLQDVKYVTISSNLCMSG